MWLNYNDCKYCKARLGMNGFKPRFHSLNNEVRDSPRRETLSLEEYSSNILNQTRAVVTTPLVAKFKIRDELASKRFEDMERVVMNGGDISPSNISADEEPKLNESYLRTIFSPFSFSLAKLLFSPKSSIILESPLSNPKFPSRNASSSVDLVSPMPMVSYSPNRELSQRQYKLKQIIAEIIESEESYIVSLKIVRNYYIEPLFIKQNFAISLPIESMYDCLDELIFIHTKLLNSIIRQQFIQNTDEFASIIGELVLELVVPYYYEEYLKIHNCTSKVIKDNEMFSSRSKYRWTNGWRNYLEATQPDTKRMDLSFLSLVQRPISRVAKYRLLLESLLKFSIGDNKENLMKSLKLLKDKLSIMNRKTITLEEDWLNNKINKLVNFSNISQNYQFEILMSFMNRQEYEIWVTQLKLLIDIVNGPYAMDYSRRKENLLIIFPEDIGYYDICVKDQTNIIDLINNCYFKNIICIDNYFKHPKDLFMNINKYNRARIETRFISVWSFQIPKLTSIELKKTYRKLKVDTIDDTKPYSDSVKFHLIRGFFSYYRK